MIKTYKRLFCIIICSLFVIQPCTQASFLTPIKKLFARRGFRNISLLCLAAAGAYVVYRYKTKQKQKFVLHKLFPNHTDPVDYSQLADIGDINELSPEKLDTIFTILFDALISTHSTSNDAIKLLLSQDIRLLYKQDKNGVTLIQIGAYINPKKFMPILLSPEFSGKYMLPETNILYPLMELEFAIINELELQNIEVQNRTTVQNRLHKVFEDSGSNLEKCRESLAATKTRLSCAKLTKGRPRKESPNPLSQPTPVQEEQAGNTQGNILNPEASTASTPDDVRRARLARFANTTNNQNSEPRAQ
jgi:hypothetical protein